MDKPKLTNLEWAFIKLRLTISFWAMIAFKLTNLIDWSWWLILWPLWVGIIISAIRTRKEWML